MAKAKAFTTRVYKYGAIPLGPFPTEGVDQLFRANQLWNKLVEIHNEHSEYYDQARRDADEEYNTLSVELDNVEERVKKAFTEKRNARNKASSRDADHPLIKAANDKIDALFVERRELWDGIKTPRARADKLIDKDALNKAFNTAVKEAQRGDNTGGLDGATANEVGRNFKEARSKVFQNPRSRLRFHRFDGTGYRFYRFRDERDRTIKTDGVNFAFFTPHNENDSRAFLLTPSKKKPSKRDKKRGVQRWHLKLKVAGWSRRRFRRRFYPLYTLQLAIDRRRRRRCFGKGQDQSQMNGLPVTFARAADARSKLRPEQRNIAAYKAALATRGLSRWRLNAPREIVSRVAPDWNHGNRLYYLLDKSVLGNIPAPLRESHCENMTVQF